MEYQYKTKPFDHQRELFERTCDMAAFALLWEQGTGKTKPTIDTAAYLHQKGLIDAVIVVAPGGVHRNWRSDELPAHLPDITARRSRVHVWETVKAGLVGVKRDREELLKHQGLAWLMIPYDAFITEVSKKYVWKFLRQRRCLYVIDEGHKIKTPSAKRTQAIVKSGKYAPFRRLLTGTPIAKGPFDIYSQLRFVQEDIWKKIGLDSFTVFKFHFGEWITDAEFKRDNGYERGYDQLIDYKNLDELYEILHSVSSRVTKDQVLDLPPKLYSKRYFTLNGEQARVYKALRDEYEAELESGERIDATLAIVRLLRLQQICCGYAQVEGDEPVRLLGNHNPLLDAVIEEAEALGHPAIIWCRFTKDIDQVMAALGKRAVRYDGSLSDDEAEQSKLAFQRGDADFFVGNAQKGAEGLTLVQAKTVMYYSNSFNLIHRLQSEDRAHRIGQEDPVSYLDFEALLPDGTKTVTRDIIRSLVKKLDIASRMTGDEFREWLR